MSAGKTLMPEISVLCALSFAKYAAATSLRLDQSKCRNLSASIVVAQCAIIAFKLRSAEFGWTSDAAVGEVKERGASGTIFI